MLHSMMSPNEDETAVCGPIARIPDRMETGHLGNLKWMRFPLANNALWPVVSCHGDFKPNT